MTIYECLGINDILINIDIPKETILKNISSNTLKTDAERCFSSIKKITLKASIHRNNHYLQIIEIKLDRANEIDLISKVIQKSIKYRILFIFNYSEHYMLLWRNFQMTESTEYVYTEHISSSTNWIYSEYFNDDIMSLFDCTEIKHIDTLNYFVDISKTKKTENDNGDSVFFRDVLNNVLALDKYVKEFNYFSCRYFIDWLHTHAVGGKYEKKLDEILSNILEDERYEFIDDHLFFEKRGLINCMLNITHSKYEINLDHTGKLPLEYFEDVIPVSFRTEDRIIAKFCSNIDNYDFIYNKEPYVVDSDGYYFDSIGERHHYKESSGGYYPETYSRNLTFIDDIIRRHRLKGYAVIEEQRLNYKIVKKLREKGYQVLEQLTKLCLTDFPLLPIEKAEVLVRMHEKKLYPSDYLESKYGDFNSYFIDKIRCEECGERVEDIESVFNGNGEREDKVLCKECAARFDRLDVYHVFQLSIDKIDKGDCDEYLSFDIELLLFSEENLDIYIQDVSVISKYGDIKKCYQIKNISNKISRYIQRLAHADDNILSLAFRGDYINRRFLLYNTDNLQFTIIDRNHKKKFVLVYKIDVSSLQAKEFDYIVEDNYNSEDYQYALPDVSNTLIDTLSFSKQTNTILKKSNINYMSELIDKSILDLFELGVLDKESILEINSALKKCGYSIKGLDTNEFNSENEAIDEYIRFWHIKKSKIISLEVEDPLYSDFTNGKSGIILYMIIKNTGIRDARLELKDCIIRKAGQEYKSDYKLYGYAFYTKNLPGLSQIRFAEMWATDAWQETQLKNGNMLVVSLHSEYEGKKYTYEFKYRRRLFQNEWELYDYTEEDILNDETVEFDDDDFYFLDDGEDEPDETPPPPQKKLFDLPNLGSSMVKRLRAVGITSVEELMQAKTEDVWDKLFEKASFTDCVEIWSIEGAKQGILYADLDDERKAELKEYVCMKKGREKPNPEDLTTLPNIGVGLAEKLKSIGISISSALKENNTESIWDRLYATYPSVGFYEIYAIEGAKADIKMKELDKDRKAQLREYVNRKKNDPMTIIHDGGNTHGKALEMSIEELDFPVRIYNCLKRAGIDTVGDLTERTFEDLIKVRNLGRQHLDPIIGKLHSLGLKLKSDK